MAASASDKLGAIGDIVALVEIEEAKLDRKRGPYKLSGKPKTVELSP